LQEILGRDHRDLVVLLNNLSVVMHKNGRNMQAELLPARRIACEVSLSVVAARPSLE
jgi:hypothetical protein